MNPIQEIAIAEIAIGKRLRAVNKGKVKDIAESIGQIGLQNPVQVVKADKGGFTLVAGAHRIAAAKSRNMQTVPAVVVDLSDLQRQLWEIDENLKRANLTAAQEAAHVKKRAEILKQLAPVSAKGGRGKKGVDSEIAAATGRSKDSIRRARTRGENIQPETLAAVEGTELDTGANLDVIAKATASEQKAIADAPPDKRAALVQGIRKERTASEMTTVVVKPDTENQAKGRKGTAAVVREDGETPEQWVKHTAAQAKGKGKRGQSVADILLAEARWLQARIESANLPRSKAREEMGDIFLSLSTMLQTVN